MPYEFGPFCVDAARCRLLRDGAPLAVPPKAFDLLLILVRNPNRMVSKRELIEALWPDTFVDDGNLTQHVFTLRKTLGAAYIETVPRRGYIFSATVRQSAAAVPDGEQARPVVVDAERKQATVMSCGLSNAIALAERLGPARFDALMTDLVGLAADEVGRYEGVIRRTRAETFEAVFGARIVHEDDPWRAVLTALSIRRSAARLVPEPTPAGDAPALRIGIATGSVVVTRRVDNGGIDYSAIGDTVRIADLLQQIAEPGTILINHTTERAVAGLVALERLEVEVEHAAAFRVAAATPARSGRPPRLMRTLAPFVGRKHEFGLLANAALRARGGRGQVVAIAGEAGIGKSRLLLEFATAMPDLTVLEARCVSFGSLVPYLPIADLVRVFCGIDDAATDEDIGRAVRGAATDLGDDAVASLLRLLGVADAATEHVSPEAIKAGIFGAVRALLVQASARRPVVVIVEDVHWIDRSSEEFLAMLIDRIVAARILIVTTFRPGCSMPWRDRSDLTHLTLTPLPPDDSGALIESVAGGAPLSAPACAEILAKADGNPFFLEELTRTVLEHGPGDRTPETVHGVIMARIDRVPEAAKRLLQTAAVLGRDVPLRLLTSVWRGASPIAELDELCRLEFLYEASDRGDRVFTFRHALTQDVAYDSLLANQRRELHLEAARALERLHAGRLDDVTARLAYHYARTELVDEALTWLIRAADRAARVYANAEAILHLNLARRRLERLPAGAGRDRAEVEVALKHAQSLYFLGRWKESVEILLPCSANLTRLHDSGVAASYAFWLAHMYTRLGDQRQAGEHARRAIDAGQRAGQPGTVGKAHGVLALDSHWSGDLDAGIAHGMEAVRILSALPDQRWWLGMAHFYLAMNHLVAGRFDAALAEAAEADTVGEDIGDPRLKTYAGFMTAWVEASRGNCEQALVVCRRSRDLAPDRVSHAFASTILGYTLLQAGDHHGAREQLEPLVDEFESFGFPQWQAWASTLIAESYRLDGMLEAAAAFVTRGLMVAGQARYWYAIGFGERIAARIDRDAGRVQESSRRFDRAAETFARIGARFEETLTRHDARAPMAVANRSSSPFGARHSET